MSDGQIVIDTRLNTEGVSSGLRRLKEEASNLGNSFVGTSNKMGSFSDNLGKVSKATNGMYNLLKPLALGLIGLGAASIKLGMDFDTSMHKVYTIADKSAVPVDKMRQAILNLSNQTGISAKDIANNVYDAISAGQKTGDAVNFVRQSTELATAGFATAGQTLDILTSIYNAYGQTSKDVAKDCDILIMTQNIGKTTVGALSQNLGLLIPVAKESGVQLNQVGAGLALMTKQGIQTSEAITNYKAMLSELNKTGSKSDKILRKITGESFEELIKKGKTVGDILNILNEYAKKNNMKLGDMFGNIRSVTGALALAGNGGKDFNDILKQMDNSTGSTKKAFDEMSHSTQYNFKKAINQAKNALIGFGDVMAPFISLASQFISKIATAFSSMTLAQKQFTVGVSSVIIAFTGIFFGISKFTGAMSEAIKNYKKIRDVMKDWGVITKIQTGLQWLLDDAIFAEVLPILAVVAVIGLLVAGFIYLWHTSAGFRNFWIGLWNGIKEACSNAVNWISKKFDELGKWFDNLGKWFNSIPSKISNWFTYISNSISNFWTNILNSINNWGISVSNKFKGWGNDISNMFKSWGNNISNFFTKTIPETFKKLGLAIVNFIKSIPSLLNKLSIIGHDYAFKMFVSLGHFLGLALGALIKWGIDVWNFFTKTIPQWITFVGEWFSKLPGRIEKWLVNAYHKVVAWGKDMIHKAVETASNFINNFTLWISQLPGRIEKWLITTYNNVVAWGSNMINKAIETASNFINNFIAWISQLPGRIANYLSTTYNNVVAWGSNMINKAIETASNFINNFINWISQLPGRFGSWLSQCLNSVANWGYNLYVAGRNAAINLVNSIVDEVKSLPSKMMQLGSYIVHGLWQGILNAKKKLMDDIRGFCGGFISGFKEGLGIHSPARKMIPIGKYTIQGVSVGMDNEMPNLNDQVKDQMSKMVNKMKATVKAETSAQSFKASFGAMTMNKSFKLMMPDQKQTIHQNINNNIVMDSDVIAAHTTHKVIENITENQDSYLVATGGIL
ncbi:phage tail tape measure protein [Clostridium thermobutyricum]|uniref:phage tail tape measure protein n=1 Tax=Clostridium thermobutyricum TaxID=29372 RepID=UPI002943B6F7|nr:phage tail tape measure protein [Clostridium thermobutyricum]